MAAPRGSMDFFAAQAAARRHTLLLVVLFVVAIALTVALADAGISMVLVASDRHATAELDPAQAWWLRFGELLLPVTAAVAAVVAVGTGWHAMQLGGDGGEAVARMMGGRPVDRLTQDPGEKRAVNVLEEMALAAAIPVPRLFVLDGEPGINAFAAGRTPDHAVVAVTRGALEQLSRDELQGVFAHELSHILNSDMRLNVRLMALIGGLTALVLLGRVILSASDSGRSWGSNRRRSGGGVALGIGLALVVAGAIGAFFARLIQLAVSREREFLADASAVQFTRNPAGLSGALSRIAAAGSALQTPHAPEAAHLFFASGVSGFLASFLATHPPIEERIRRLGAVPLATLPRRTSAVAGAAPSPAAGLASAAAAPALTVARAAVATVGRPEPRHLEAAATALAGFPSALVDAAREPFGARALALALLLDADPAVRARQRAALAESAVAAEVWRLGGALEALPRASRLPLLDLGLPALDRLSADQAQALVRDLASMAQADGRVTVYEWALQRLVRRRLARQLGAAPTTIRARALEQVEPEALELLSALAWTGQRDPAAVQQALDAGTQAMGVAARWRVLPLERFTAAGLDAVLSRLDEAAPPLKARLLAGVSACVLSDGRVTIGEAELVRAVAGSLGLPMPALAETAQGPAVTAA